MDAKTVFKAAASSAKARFARMKKQRLVLPPIQPLQLKSFTDTRVYKKLKGISGQEQQYREHGASEEVMKLVKLTSKTFGTVVEEMTRERWSLEDRTNVQHDALYKGKKIEIKSARYWAGTDDCRWQHLFPTYDYDILLLVLLDYTEFRYWVIKKETAFATQLITAQGDQGHWFQRSDMQPHLVPIHSLDDLNRFVASL